MDEYITKFYEWINVNQLLIIEVTRHKQRRQTILGRLVQFDSINHSILVYLDDTKSVESFTLNQIDHIGTAS
jgi:hypothetical protein